MRIVIPTTGSRGDVQPYVALAMGLQAAGHRVRLATHADFASFIRERGLDFYPIEAGARAFHESDAGQKMLNAGANPFVFMRQYARMRQPLMHSLLAKTWEASVDADVILIANTGFFLGQAVAEKLGIPFVFAHYVPTRSSWFRSNCLFLELPAWLPGCRLYNMATHLVAGEFFWQLLRSSVNSARHEVLNLPPFPFSGPSMSLFDHPTLCGCSTAVVPRPRDWGEQQQMTGFWFLDSSADWKPPAGLPDFLAAGPPPVCIGFGSMSDRDPQQLTDLVVAALKRTGQRGLLLSGWGGLKDPVGSDELFVAGSMPHDWLFPRMAAVVHHGGAGTVAAVFRAGVPSVVVPFMADQPFWGRRVLELGVGPRPILRERLTVERLAAAIRVAVTDPQVRRRAAEFGQRIRQEDGVGRAVELFEQFTKDQEWQTAPSVSSQPMLLRG